MEDEDIKPVYNHSPHSFELSPVNEFEISKCIAKLKTKATPDLNGLSTKVLKQCHIPLVTVLTKLINSSFQSGVFPDSLKHAKILPIYKGKGDKSNVDNYRPISILPVFSKVFESIVKNKLLDFMYRFNLLNPSQHGFINGKSTETAILDFVSYVSGALDCGSKVSGAFLDLSKAFDTVDHEILLTKLSVLGVQPSALKWFKSFLSGRKQTTAVDVFNSDTRTFETFFSSSAPVQMGVPQGSVLGPLLFVVYINDLSLSLISGTSKTVLYADDTNALFVHRNVPELQVMAQTGVNNVLSYFQSNLLTVNPNKSSLINFCKKGVSHAVSLHIGNNPIETANHTKFLGVTIDDHLNWHQHTLALKSKLNSVCFTQRILSNSCSPDIVRTAYFAYFHSLLNYGIVFWGNQKQNLDSVFKAQKRCLRIMCKKSPRTHCKPLFSKLLILPVPCVYIYRCATLVRSSSNALPLNSDLHSHNTRKKDDFFVERSISTLGQNSPLNAGIRIHNSLPRDIKSEPNNGKFKSLLKTYLHDQLFYSVEELFNVQ